MDGHGYWIWEHKQTENTTQPPAPSTSISTAGTEVLGAKEVIKKEELQLSSSGENSAMDHKFRLCSSEEKKFAQGLKDVLVFFNKLWNHPWE